ncbi:unnamed protein product, partial [Medioppia subpectinata]
MAINAGGLLSMFFTPMMREDVQCFGRTTCYPLAFGVPALLMLVALALFVSGRYLTTYVFVPPQKESVVVQVVKCVFISLLRKLFKKLPKRDHWLDYADDKYDKQTIEDIKAVMRVLFLYIPIPLFFALFNQTFYVIATEHSFINYNHIYHRAPGGVTFAIFTNHFNHQIYPHQLCYNHENKYGHKLIRYMGDLGKFGMLKKPLQRIVVGGVLAGISFAICGFFQLSIENQLPPVISGHSIHVSIVNGLNSEIKVKNSLLFPSESLTLEKYNVFTLNNVNIDELTSNGLTFNITLNDVTNIPGCLPNRDYFLKLSPGFQRSGLLFITESICELTNELKILEFDQELNLLAKPANGGALAAIAYNIRDSVSKPVLNIKNDAYITFKLNNSAFTEYFNSTTNDGHPIITGDTKRYVGYVPYKKELNVHKGGNYELLLLENDQDNLAHSATNGIELLQGGAYVSIIYTDENGKLAGVTHNLVKPNTLSVLMQIIPYAIITFGEIMLQVTGLEFSYSQAPASMKSLVGAAWYLTVAFGDLIVIIISSAKLFDDLSNEFFFFAGLMVADMIVFAIIAYFYQPYKGTTDDGDKKSEPAHDNYPDEAQPSVPKLRYPRSVPFIIGNEFCERFTYYGAKTILVLYFTQIIRYSDNEATDVSAFGGDQFGPGQEKHLARFFSFFYIAINAGSLLSTSTTPIMREDVMCFGRTSCYPLAFGVPAVLMIVALVLFVSGRYLTTYVINPPQKESIVLQVVKCTSLSRKWFKKVPKRDHWLDYADDKYDAQTLADIKAVMRVLFLYLPLPIFWALFNQQGSRWTLQATKMDGKLGSYRMKPDQIGIVNPILIILCIPLFNYVIYPVLIKFNLLKRPLQRMVAGGVLAGVAFAICGFYQLSIETELPPALSGHSIHMTIVNGLNSEITVKNSLLFTEKSLSLDKYNIHTIPNVDINELTSKGLTFDITLTGGANIPGCLPNVEYSQQLSPEFQRSDLLAKPVNGGALAAVAYNIRDSVSKPTLNIKNDAYITFKFDNSEFVEYFRSTTSDGHPTITGDTKRYEGYVPYKKELSVHKGGEYELLLLATDLDSYAHLAIKGIDLLQGGAYLSIIYSDENGKLAGITHNLVAPNSLSVFLQVIQYAVITAGEIMFSITGLEFSYSQAPHSMKSIVTAAWLLTVAFGDLLIIIISSAQMFDE